MGDNYYSPKELAVYCFFFFVFVDCSSCVLVEIVLFFLFVYHSLTPASLDHKNGFATEIRART